MIVDRPAGALPGCFEFAAPGGWRRIDFISDLHLCEAMPRTFEAWRRHLLDTPADAVFVLGDLFELWVGDDARHAGFAARCVDVLVEAARRRTLAIMVGNRDFLIGAELLRECAAVGLPDPSVLAAWGQRIVLTHGDLLCLDDHDYQAFRAQVRSPGWQRDFLARPLAARLELARAMRQASAERQRFDGDLTLDIDRGAALRWLHDQGAAALVHGHTHRAGSDELAPGLWRHVLGDWDLDGAAPRAEVLRLTRAGFERVPPVSV
ncbi:MAG: UDP-2,3-diacylglucosamine diphosphatase [Proteobacteria bacterium]|nr:UDP-2,3-diacylglucosamine diphosphatase [Pseudomonadota bacterium]